MSDIDEMDTDEYSKVWLTNRLLKGYRGLVAFEQRWNLESAVARLPVLNRRIVSDFLRAREEMREAIFGINQGKLDLTIRRNNLREGSGAIEDIRKRIDEFKDGLVHLMYAIDRDVGSYDSTTVYDSIAHQVSDFRRNELGLEKEKFEINSNIERLFNCSNKEQNELRDYFHFSQYALPPLVQKGQIYDAPIKPNISTSVTIYTTENIVDINGDEYELDQKKIEALIKLYDLTGKPGNKPASSKDVIGGRQSIEAFFTGGTTSHDSKNKIVYDLLVKKIQKKNDRNIGYRMKIPVIII